jgi:hypothetical protein
LIDPDARTNIITLLAEEYVAWNEDDSDEGVDAVATVAQRIGEITEDGQFFHEFERTIQSLLLVRNKTLQEENEALKQAQAISDIPAMVVPEEIQFAEEEMEIPAVER